MCDPTVGAIQSDTRAEPERGRKEKRAQKFSFLSFPATSPRGIPGTSENHFCACFRSPLVFVKTPGLASVELSLKGPLALRHRRRSLTPSVQLLFVFIFPGSSFVLLRRYRVMGTPSGVAPHSAIHEYRLLREPRATREAPFSVRASCPLAPG